MDANSTQAKICTFRMNYLQICICAIVLFCMQWTIIAKDCQFYELLAIDGSCIDCSEAWPGCFMCNSKNCLSCADGFFYVPDKQLCVQDCSFVEIDATEANQAPYFADFVSKQCLKCDRYCVNCKDGQGCTQCVADRNGDPNSLVLLENSSGLGYCANCSDLDPTCLLCQSDGQCALRQGISTSTGITCVESNCATCNQTEKFCDSCAQGFVMTLSGCISKQCHDQNCLDCDASLAICTTCKLGYHLDTTSKCAQCPNNCEVCDNSCSICNIDYMLSLNGTCVQSCGSNEVITSKVINPPYQGIYEAFQCETKYCDSNCFACDGNDNFQSQCSLCVLNKYKYNKTDTNEIVIFVSNLNGDINRDFALQNGTIDSPFADLMMAYDAAFGAMLPYLLDINGNLITVRIALFSGDHFVVKQQHQYRWLNQNCYKNFKVVISPFYCTYASNSDDSRCVSDGSRVNVFVKTGQDFKFETSKDFVIENINFDFTDSIVSVQNDPDNCLSLRRRCCQVILGQIEQIVKLNSSVSCVDQWKTNWQSHCYYRSALNIFDLPDVYPDYNGISIPPTLSIINSTFQYIYFEFNAIINLKNAGWISITGSNFSHISSCGSIINDFEYVGYNADGFIFSYFDSTYQSSFAMRYPLNNNSIDCDQNLNCILINIQNSVFSDWLHEFRNTRSNYDYYINSRLTGLISIQMNDLREFTLQNSEFQNIF